MLGRAWWSVADLLDNTLQYHCGFFLDLHKGKGENSFFCSAVSVKRVVSPLPARLRGEEWALWSVACCILWSLISLCKIFNRKKTKQISWRGGCEMFTISLDIVGAGERLLQLVQRQKSKVLFVLSTLVPTSPHWFWPYWFRDLIAKIPSLIFVSVNVGNVDISCSSSWCDKC